MCGIFAVFFGVAFLFFIVFLCDVRFLALPFFFFYQCNGLLIRCVTDVICDVYWMILLFILRDDDFVDAVHILRMCIMMLRFAHDMILLSFLNSCRDGQLYHFFYFFFYILNSVNSRRWKCNRRPARFISSISVICWEK